MIKVFFPRCIHCDPLWRIHETCLYDFAYLCTNPKACGILYDLRSVRSWFAKHIIDGWIGKRCLFGVFNPPRNKTVSSKGDTEYFGDFHICCLVSPLFYDNNPKVVPMARDMINVREAILRYFQMEKRYLYTYIPIATKHGFSHVTSPHKRRGWNRTPPDVWDHCCSDFRKSSDLLKSSFLPNDAATRANNLTITSPVIMIDRKVTTWQNRMI